MSFRADSSKTGSALSWFWALAVCAFLADQASKYAVFARLDLHESAALIPNFLYLTHNPLNQGAVFGWGKDHGTLANYCFAGFSLLAMLFIVFWSRRPEVKADRFLLTALALILGGAAGNFYDRLLFAGVRDFIHVHHEAATWRFDFAVFNVADSCLVVGASLLFLHTVFQPRQTPPPEAAAPHAGESIAAAAR
jgi:lipoprotein signal peptidase